MKCSVFLVRLLTTGDIDSFEVYLMSKYLVLMNSVISFVT